LKKLVEISSSGKPSFINPHASISVTAGSNVSSTTN